MSQTVHIPHDLAQRLAAEAERRGVSVEEVVVTEVLAAGCFPVRATESRHDALDAFIGSGSSDRREPFDIHQERARLAERNLAEEA
jgi:thioredoxin reductase